MTEFSSKYYSTKNDGILRTAKHHLYWGKEMAKLRKKNYSEIIDAGEEISFIIMRSKLSGSYRSEKTKWDTESNEDFKFCILKMEGFFIMMKERVCLCVQVDNAENSTIQSYWRTQRTEDITFLLNIEEIIILCVLFNTY